MWKIQVNKINSWFQTIHNKDIYQWRTHKYKSISSRNKKHIKQKKIYSFYHEYPNRTKTNVARAKKSKIQSEAPRYNLNNSTSSNQQKWNTLPLKTKQSALSKQICTPPFCDEMPKGNQNPSSKGGGDE